MCASLGSRRPGQVLPHEKVARAVFRATPGQRTHCTDRGSTSAAQRLAACAPRSGRAVRCLLAMMRRRCGSFASSCAGCGRQTRCSPDAWSSCGYSWTHRDSWPAHRDNTPGARGPLERAARRAPQSLAHARTLHRNCDCAAVGLTGLLRTAGAVRGGTRHPRPTVTRPSPTLAQRLAARAVHVQGRAGWHAARLRRHQGAPRAAAHARRPGPAGGVPPRAGRPGQQNEPARVGHPWAAHQRHVRPGGAARGVAGQPLRPARASHGARLLPRSDAAWQPACCRCPSCVCLHLASTERARVMQEG